MLEFGFSIHHLDSLLLVEVDARKQKWKMWTSFSRELRHIKIVIPNNFRQKCSSMNFIAVTICCLIDITHFKWNFSCFSIKSTSPIESVTHQHILHSRFCWLPIQIQIVIIIQNPLYNALCVTLSCCRYITQLLWDVMNKNSTKMLATQRKKYKSSKTVEN